MPGVNKLLRIRNVWQKRFPLEQGEINVGVGRSGRFRGGGSIRPGVDDFPANVIISN